MKNKGCPVCNYGSYPNCPCCSEESEEKECENCNDGYVYYDGYGNPISKFEYEQSHTFNQDLMKEVCDVCYGRGVISK